MGVRGIILGTLRQIHLCVKGIGPPPRNGEVNQRITAPSLEPAGMLRIAGSQMAWKGCAAVRANLRAGAKQIAPYRSQFICWPSDCDSRHAARVNYGGYSAPLRSHARISRIPFQATSGWGNVMRNFALLLPSHPSGGRQVYLSILLGGGWGREDQLRLFLRRRWAAFAARINTINATLVRQTHQGPTWSLRTCFALVARK
jgi:hypothetical protein